jgi:hypothetical protein
MWRIWTAAAAAAALLGVWTLPAVAQIGVTSAVLPTARGTPPQQRTRVLEIGSNMFANERVQTAENGKVHLLFQDGSALSVGPNSDIVLDTFVYDPNTRTGELTMTATRGIFRFVGGRISKSSPVTLRTPSATIGIRGGVGLFSIRDITRAALVFGEQLSVDTGTRRQTVNRNGYEIRVLQDGSLTEPARFNSADLSGDLDQLEGTEDQTGETQSLVSENDVAGSQISSLGSGLSPLVTGVTDPANATAAADLIGNNAVEQSVEIDQVQQAEAQPGGTSGTTDIGFMTAVGLTGRYRDALSRFFGTEIDEVFDEPINNGSLGGGIFSGTATIGGSPIMWPVSTALANDGSPGSGSFLTQTATFNTDSPFGPLSNLTSFVADSQDFTFVYAQLANFSANDFIFAFAGMPTPASSIPNSGFAAYSLKRDLHLNGDLPFIPEMDGGNFGVNVFDTGRAFINWTPNSAGERAFAELTTVYNGLSSLQKSQTSIAVGKIIDDGTGKLHLLGEVRGSLRTSTDVTVRTIYYDGDLATVDGVDGSDFFGSSAPNFFVLGNQETNATDSFTDLTGGGIDKIVGGSVSEALYNANVVATRLAGNGPSDAPTRTSGTTTYKLETAGIAMEYLTGGNNFGRIVTNETDALTSNFITGNGTNGTITANASFIGFDTSGSGSISTGAVSFGGNTSNSAFVSDDEFVAIESGALVNGASTSVLGYFRSLDLRFESLLSSFGLTPCGCEFLVAGLWGGQLVSGGNQYDFHQVPWVAGAPVSASDFPTSLTATYSGNAVAQVFDTNVVYTAFGTFNAVVSFSPGIVTLSDVDISVAGASMLNLAGGGSTSSQLFFPFSGMGSIGMTPLTVNGNARFAGTPGTLENIYGHYVATDGSTYRQAGVFGAER